jgi:hypothetical protein
MLIRFAILVSDCINLGQLQIDREFVSAGWTDGFVRFVCFGILLNSCHSFGSDEDRHDGDTLLDFGRCSSNFGGIWQHRDTDRHGECRRGRGEAGTGELLRCICEVLYGYSSAWHGAIDQRGNGNP